MTHTKGRGGSPKEAKANARLISDLLSALKAAEQFIHPEIGRGPDVNGWANTVEMVTAAIKKAEQP